ncbi:hypothetical protein Kpol_1045p66 [Vanderwaltozyma polyspora DSM 70294]|uniref:Uncharacterized protein n=1 Tax=Vanderwaltozyma polyspora (strain ATCC 22028 / DSM 70294 / BCRC 21397 / CBS 2163 / NBRC 10782 / NRRL Y-8283 / UCD 57-17) TaxID=436907 RepID=A7TI72_VANPO|nr:uncharacterized protein Kpol_1045p66 [Vanderwaltozyma polyspora DSM 70294]EDO18079.1 hypothetical protein Kpol_1045p66 [Vanderwaltozyma polyspora DSM 70294]
MVEDNKSSEEESTPIPSRMSTPLDGDGEGRVRVPGKSVVGGPCSSEHSAGTGGSGSGSGGTSDQRTRVSSSDGQDHSKVHRIIFKPLPADSVAQAEGVRCYKLPEGNKIKQIFLPANITNPEEIAKILKAASAASTVITNHRNTVNNSDKPTVSPDPVVVVETQPPAQKSAKPIDEMTLEERISYIKTSLQGGIPLPPVNTHCLKEIEVQEIAKNAQLRHDIVFDPNLQFRPNLDGNLGIKKKELADEYWKEVENEIFVYQKRRDVFESRRTRLVPIFDNLRNIILTIVAPKDAQMVKNILETSVCVQGIITGSLDILQLADWICKILKGHCAPMRDTFMKQLYSKFEEATTEDSLSKFVGAIRFLFHVLEIMKLDVANHQIRLLRPALVSNTVEFERQYYQTILSTPNNKLIPSFDWFKIKYNEEVTKGKLIAGQTTPQLLYRFNIRNILELASCHNMVQSYPVALGFDRSRLILLRTNIRQIVCLMICRLLFKQLISQHKNIDTLAKNYITTKYTDERLKSEIMSLITEEHGNFKWTKNTMSIALQLCKVIEELYLDYLRETKLPQYGIPQTVALDEKQIEFAKAWLSKQIQPNSPVYILLETRVFKSLEDIIYSRSGCTVEGNVKQDFLTVYSKNASYKNKMTSSTNEKPKPDSELESEDTDSTNDNNVTNDNDNDNGSNRQQQIIPLSLSNFENTISLSYVLSNFHWSVFGFHYIKCLGNNMKKP